MQVLQSDQKIMQVQQVLSKNDYFSRSPLPGFADAVIFKFLYQNKKYPDRKIFPYFYHWYVIMKQFSLQSLDEWIRSKRYIQNQSQRCIIIISELFYKLGHYKGIRPSRKASKKTSLDMMISDGYIEPVQSQTLQPIDLNSPRRIHSKAQYSMLVQVRIIQNLEQMFNRFYQLKIKIRQLKYLRKEKSIYVKFLVDSNLVQEIKKEILGWNQVRHVISKEIKPQVQKRQGNQETKSVMKTLSIR